MLHRISIIDLTDSQIKRFWSYVEKGPGCWEWIGGKKGQGYGAFRVKGKMVLAHRISCFLNLGEKFNNELMVCHTCDNIRCVNPDHLWQGTNKDNLQDMSNKCRYYGHTRKVTIDQVEEIKKVYSEYEVTQKDIAIEYGVSVRTIARILRILVVLFLLSGCSFQHYIEPSLGYAPGFDQGSNISKRQSILAGVRHVAERPLWDSGFTWGLMSGFQLSYTEDAFQAHNYDYREYRFREQVVVSYPWLVTPYIAGGMSYNILEADSDFVDDEEWQSVVTAGVRYSRYFFEYQGMNTQYMADTFNPYCVNHWLNMFLIGVRF